jgi:prolyl 4-hydroxylase
MGAGALSCQVQQALALSADLDSQAPDVMTESLVATYPNPDKAALKRAGDVVRKRLLADPKVYQVPSDKAEIFAVGEFLSSTECDHLMKMIDAVAKPSSLYDSGASQGPDFRTSYSGDVDPGDRFVKMVERRIDDLLGIPHAYGETMQGQRYRVGQQFKPHMDWFFTQAPYWKTEHKRGGQRCWTAMIYLNDVEEGGTTDFTRIGVSIPPQQGALLCWNNATPDGMPNEDVMHAGTPVLQGVKYVITKWYRTRRWG